MGNYSNYRFTCYFVSFGCSDVNCQGTLQSSGKCKQCGTSVDLESRKRDIEEIKINLLNLRKKMDGVRNKDETMDLYEKTLSQWRRLLEVAKHPYKYLYVGEQIFWKIVRLTYGNIILSESK